MTLCIGADASCSFSDVTATRLSATDLSIQFRYFYRPGGISNISVYSNEFFVTILDSISIGPEIVSADKVQYDYLYSGASGPRCFRAQPDILGCPMSEDCANSSYSTTSKSPTSSTLFMIIVLSLVYRTKRGLFYSRSNQQSRFRPSILAVGDQ